MVIVPDTDAISLAMSEQPKKRGRPRKADRGDILEAGFLEFAENGFRATRLDDVAARAGVAKGTVYLYFESKEALFEAAVRSRIVPAVEQAGHLVQGFEGSTAELLRRVLEAVYERIAEPNVCTLLRIVIAEGPRFPALVAFYHREVIARMLTLLETVLRRGIARGEYPAGALTRFPAVLIAPAIMAAIWQMTFATAQDVPLATFKDAHADLIERALGGRPRDVHQLMG